MSPPGRGADAAVGVSQALAVLLVHLGGEENRQLVAGAPTQRSPETKLQAGIRNLFCPPAASQVDSLSLLRPIFRSSPPPVSYPFNDSTAL